MALKRLRLRAFSYTLRAFWILSILAAAEARAAADSAGGRTDQSIALDVLQTPPATEAPVSGPLIFTKWVIMYTCFRLSNQEVSYPRFLYIIMIYILERVRYN